MPNNIPYFEDTELKVGVRTVERDTVNVIVYNPITGQVIVLKWRRYGWRTFIIGGIDPSDEGNPIRAAIREVAEETGYTRLKFVAEIGKIRAGYYAAHKGENRIAIVTGLLFELENDDRDEVPNSEKLPHTFRWIPVDQVSAFLTLASQRYLWGEAQGHLPKK